MSINFKFLPCYSRIDSQLYTEILDDCLFQSVEYNIEKGSLIFQHDNDPKHTLKLTEK